MVVCGGGQTTVRALHWFVFCLASKPDALVIVLVNKALGGAREALDKRPGDEGGHCNMCLFAASLGFDP